VPNILVKPLLLPVKPFNRVLNSRDQEAKILFLIGKKVRVDFIFNLLYV
jgi:hypothetical protein